MESKYKTKKIPELAKELLNKRRNEPVEWWANELAKARKDAYLAHESKRMLHTSRHYDERRGENMEIVNSNLLKLLKKAGFKQTRLRITEDWKGCRYNDDLSDEEKEDGQMCWPTEYNGGCDDCESLYYQRAVQTIASYDYEIVDDALEAITAELKTYETGDDILLKVEDISDPKRPIVIWEAKHGD